MHEDELDDRVPLEQYGVDSLVAIEIVKRLSEQVGPLPQTVLFDYRSIEELADYLTASRSDAIVRHVDAGSAAAPAATSVGDQFLVPVCTTGSSPTSFWVHSVVGEYSWVVRLSRHLGEGWPVYAFQTRGPNFQRQQFASLAQLASAYVAALRNVQPSGPYVLGGYSYGGALAFEMARQIEQAGERVSWLILLDALAPGSQSLHALQQGSQGPAPLVEAAANLLSLQWTGEPLPAVESPDAHGRETQIDHAARRLASKLSWITQPGRRSRGAL